MSATDELVAAAKELAAELRAHYMLPNTWPTSQRFLRAVEALEAEATSASPSAESAAPSSSVKRPADAAAVEQRRAPQGQP